MILLTDIVKRHVEPVSGGFQVSLDFPKHKAQPKPPKGYQPIPGSRARGFRKRKGARWEYWYPHLGHTPRSEAHVLGDAPSTQGRPAQLLKDAQNVLRSPSEVAKRVWGGLKATVLELPEAMTTIGKLVENQPLDRKEFKALVSVTTMVGTAALVASAGGAVAATAAVSVKFATHVALTALHNYLDNTYTGAAGLDFLDTMLTVAGVFKAQAVRDHDAEAQRFVLDLVQGMKEVVDKMTLEEVRKYT